MPRAHTTSGSMTDALYDPHSFEEAVDVSQPSDEEFEMFKQQMSQWLKLDDQVRKLSIAIRERRTQQRALAEKIQEFMIKFKYDDVNTTVGRVKSNVRQAKVPLKIGDIREKIVEMRHLSGDELVEAIFAAERPIVEKRSLRRIIPKVSMSLDL